MSAILVAHGVLAVLAWALFFPLGGLIMRWWNHPKIAWIHAGTQAFALVMFIAAVGLGINLALNNQAIGSYHAIIGLTIFALACLQPLGGLVHHKLNAGHRGVWSYAHIWVGRILITLGMINGGFGLQLAAPTPTRDYIAYGVVVGLAWITWVVLTAIGEARQNKRRASVAAQEQRNSEDTLQGDAPAKEELV